MVSHPVRAASEGDRAPTAALLARAFIDDPALAYLFPDAAGRPQRLRRFFRLIASVDPSPSLWTLSLDPGGMPQAAALWRPPGAWKTPLSAMLARLPALLGAFGLALPRALAMQSALEAHHPMAPHWYLQSVGCEPAAQGLGHGGAAIRDRLALCDAEGWPAALETATPGNVGLDQALGFVITDEFRIGGRVDFWAMWREPR